VGGSATLEWVLAEASARAPRLPFAGLGDTAPMRTAIAEVRSIVGMLVAGEWALLDRLTPGSAVSAADLRSAVIDYGPTLVMPPAAALAEFGRD